jgi:outer membrane protein assembly factor BamB
LSGLGGALALLACLVGCAGASAAPTGIGIAGRGLSLQTNTAPELPPVSSTGATVLALWQAPLYQATVSENLVIGLVAGAETHGLRAVSALTGQSVWTAPLPASEPEVLRVFADGGVVVVEVGRAVGRAGFFVVTGDLVFDAASGRQLWSVGVAQGTSRVQHQPIAYVAGLIVIGDASGGIVARDAHTGAVVWRRADHPCHPGGGFESPYELRLAADSGLLVVSYHCRTGDRVFVRVQRLAPRTGAHLWQWSSIVVLDTPQSFIDLSVLSVATQGDIVLLSGQVSSGRRYARTLPRPHAWPSSLGPVGENELLVALDARSGRARWTELGGQLETVTLTDGVTCETVTVGFECREDNTGIPSRRVLRTTRSEGDSPPYIDDGYAGISGSLAGVVLSQAPTGAVSIAVIPLRGDQVIARATAQLGSGIFGGANYQDFVVGAGPLPGGATLLLLRRVDVAGYPLVALSVGQ